jgi:anti-sigma regulatory factor (Ser/Thr protein kinase)/PAS domain-containing protein
MPHMSDTLDKKGVISVRNALIIGVIIVLSYAAISNLLKGDEELRADVLNVHTVISDIFATLCLFYGAYHSKYHKRMYIAWMLIAFSRLSFTLGDIVWTIIETVMHQSPFPSLADAGFLGFYPLFALGILILPKEPLTSSEKMKVFLDTGIVMVASVIMFWIQLISPTIASNAQENSITLALAVAYPVADLLVLFGLIELLFRRIKSISFNPIFFLVASMCFLIITDFIFLDKSLKGTYVSGELLDTGWIAAYALMGAAGISQANSSKLDLRIEVNESKTVQFTWPFYIPSICIGIIYLLLIWNHYHPLPISFSSLSLTLGGIIGLFIIRQVIALNENAILFEEKVRENTQRKSAEEETRKLNESLEERVAERTAQIESTNKELMIEIQERMKAENAQRESQQLMSDIISFLPEAIMAIDLNGKVMIWNRAMEILTGVMARDILGKGDYEYSLPFYGYKRPILIDMVLRPHEGWEAEYFSFKREGTAVAGEVFIPTFGPHGSYLLAKATALYDEIGNTVGAIESVRDMTEGRLMEQKLERSRTELLVAAEIQRSFIPKKTPSIPNFEVAAVTIPAMEVGGDFYDFISLPDGNFGLVIADVAGKSIPAALFMALSRMIIRASVVQQSLASEVLKNANNMIVSDSTAGMFVTLLFGILEGEALTLKYADAGHPTPLIFKSRDCRYMEVAASGIALGAEDGVAYEDRTIKFEPGDVAVFYTDGVTEAMNPQEELYGLKRLIGAVSRICQSSAEEIMGMILEDISAFRKDREQNDDITLVVLKASRNAERHNLIEIRSRDEEIHRVTEEVDNIMYRAGFDMKAILDVQLAVEEACINIIRHGYRGVEGIIRIAFDYQDDQLMVTIKDHAPIFDPTRFETSDFSVDLEQRPIGGLGIHLMKSLVDEMRYEFEEGNNKLTLIKKKTR